MLLNPLIHSSVHLPPRKMQRVRKKEKRDSRKKVTAKYMKSKLNYLKPYVPKM